MTPTGRNPLNQTIHGIVTPMAFAISAIAIVFGASPVRNMLLVTIVAASAVYRRYEPMRLAVA